jgi:hypothetical protein
MTTPGRLAAAVVSIRAMRACASDERMTAAWRVPGSRRSST